MEGYFRNGDQWTGATVEEDGKRFYIAIDHHGNEYETLEMPTRYPLLTMIRLPDGMPELAARAALARAHASLAGRTAPLF